MFLAQFLLVTAQKQNLYCPFCVYHIEFLVEIFILLSYCLDIEFKNRRCYWTAQNWYWVRQWGFHQRDKMLRIWSPFLPPFSVTSSLIAVKVPAYFMLLVSAFFVSLKSIKMLWLYLYPMQLIHCNSRTFGCDNLS